jgi:hypothetical protein
MDLNRKLSKMIDNRVLNITMDYGERRIEGER